MIIIDHRVCEKRKNGQGAIKYGRLAEFLPENPDFHMKFRPVC